MNIPTNRTANTSIDISDNTQIHTEVVSRLKATSVIVGWAIALPLFTACSSPQEGVEQDTAPESEQESTDSTSQGMELFEGSFEEALALAAQEEKLVFVDAYTMWCGPCIVMQETVFPLPEVGEYFNPRFVNLKLDIENEDQNGPEIETRYKIGVVPTYLILDSEGNEKGRAVGGASPSQFISMISRLLGESQSTFADMQARYEEGERSTEFVQQYLKDAIVELAFREIDNQDYQSVRAFFDEGAKYKKIADEYFASRPYSELINETDAQLVMYFHEKSSRGDELVEFVLDNYDEFLAVTSESAMAQLTLNATLGAVASAARAGDETFTDYIDALETYPLKNAVDHERNRYPDSNLLPERMKYSWEPDFLKAKGDWGGVYELYKQRIEAWGENATAAHYQWASGELSGSDNPEHLELAAEYGKRAFNLDSVDPYIAARYVSALVSVGNHDEALQIANDYRAGLTDSEADQSNLELFERITSSSLEEESEGATTQ